MTEQNGSSTLVSDDSPILEAQLQASIQERDSNLPLSGKLNFLSYLYTGAYNVPAWWSGSRDIQLRAFWKRSDHLSGAVFNMISKMTAIPFQIIPKNPSDPEQVASADHFQETLMYGSEFGAGWHVFYTKWLEDLLTQDNGAFGEIIGPGPKSKPLTTAPLGVAHLDAARCQRTGHPEWPVLYNRMDGKIIKLHYARVMMSAQMESPDAEMLGVGFCAVSRCLNVTQTLVDMFTFKQEKMGSRPHRAILVTKGGLDPDDIASAFMVVDAELNNQNLSRYAKIAVVGERSLTEAGIEMVELASLPDGFEEKDSTTLAMATIAMALGIDARELFPAMQAGATRADALLQHLKQRGKGPGQIIQIVERLIKYLFLPSFLTIKFDFQDDAEDRQQAEIQGLRAQSRERDLLSKARTIRTIRLEMVRKGEIRPAEFDAMELADGRLGDGTSVLTMFYRESVYPSVNEVVDLGVEHPDDLGAHDAEVMLKKISTQVALAHEAIGQAEDQLERLDLQNAVGALDRLAQLYSMDADVASSAELEDEEDDNMPEGMEGDRMRKGDTLNPNQGTETDSRDDLRESPDDSPVLKEVNENLSIIVGRLAEDPEGFEEAIAGSERV